MAQTLEGTTTLGITIRNTGAAPVPRTGQRVGPGTSNQGPGLHITPRPGGTALHHPMGVGTKITGQVLHSLASTSMAQVNLFFLLDTGAQCSCIGKCIFVEMGGDLKSLSKLKNSFIFGDGPSTPSLGRAKIDILGYIFYIDIVSCDIPGLIGMDILSKSI